MNRIKTISIVSAAVFAALTAHGCTNREDMAVKNLAVKATVSLGSWYKPAGDFKSTGTVETPKWESGDRVALKLENGGNAAAATAAPLNAGQMSSLFLFNISTRGGETPALAYFPADAELSISGEKLSYTIQTEQTGENVSPTLFDFRRIRIGAYAPAEFSLKTGSALLLVNVAMGDYDVASVEITANGGEGLAGDVEYDMGSGTFTAASTSVRYTPSSPVSCRNGSIYIPFYCAPGKLSKGIKAKITTTNGDVMTSSAEDEIVLERS